MVELKGIFEGWSVDEDLGIIYDDGGNEYTAGEIRAIFFTRQWMYESGGYHGRIRNLKDHLDKKIARTKIPEVTITWSDVQEKLVHPFYRK